MEDRVHNLVDLPNLWLVQIGVEHLGAVFEPIQHRGTEVFNDVEHFTEEVIRSLHVPVLFTDLLYALEGNLAKI